MREVKFRGKSIDEEKTGWFYGDYCSTPNPNILFEDLDGEIDCEPIVPETVGQYTGLQDKNGKEVYEGDIIQIKDHAFQGAMNIDGNYEVYYNDYMELCCGGLILFRQLPYLTVIGNIYENPELLEEQT
jgi:hypothetical protein